MTLGQVSANYRKISCDLHGCPTTAAIMAPSLADVHTLVVRGRPALLTSAVCATLHVLGSVSTID